MQMLAAEPMAKLVATKKPSARAFSALIAAVALAGAASAVIAQARPNWLLTFSLSSRGGHIIGNPAAANKIVEYASYTCGHCAHFEAHDAPLVKNQLVAGGKTSFEIRNLVRDPLDLTAAMLARCGGTARFFGNHRLLMATQGQWAQGSKLSRPTLALLEAKKTVAFMQAAYTELGFDQIMAQRGIKPAQARACLADKASLDVVLGMTEEAMQTLKISSTPTLMVNGKIIPGHDFATLKQHLTN